MPLTYTSFSKNVGALSLNYCRHNSASLNLFSMKVLTRSSFCYSHGNHWLVSQPVYRLNHRKFTELSATAKCHPYKLNI